ncbi:chloramphenicol resistance leader peptide [Glutamicibacter sp. NPDC090743]
MGVCLAYPGALAVVTRRTIS